MSGSLYTAYKASRCIPFLESACGQDLYSPIRVLENPTLLVARGHVVELGKNISLPKDCRCVDLGDVTIAPPNVNCHTHLQFSWVGGRTEWGKGFVAWLKSLVPHILSFLKDGPPPGFSEAIFKTCSELAESGCIAAGDIGGSLPGALALVDQAAQKNGIAIRHFCEWFGFANTDAIWPERCLGEIARDSALAARCAPAGHALYSTAPEIMQRSHAACKKLRRKFTFHLAESREEEELLLSGAGDMADFYRDTVLPAGWRPPGLTPFHYAKSLGLLDSATIAVHGVWLNGDEIRTLAASGAALCLCPRSNRNLAVGTAPVKALIDFGVPLCLGTDGLSSCEDVDLRCEARYLREKYDLPGQVLLRMASANGARALGLRLPVLAPGQVARFSVWQKDIAAI